VKDNPREPLGGVDRPRERKWLSSTEVGFLKFLEQKEGPAHKRAA
jgi:hypothetical protein